MSVSDVPCINFIVVRWGGRGLLNGKGGSHPWKTGCSLFSRVRSESQSLNKNGGGMGEHKKCNKIHVIFFF